MTSEQWFRLGVLAQLKEAGLSPPEQIKLIESYGKLSKQAIVSVDAKIDPIGVLGKILSDWGPVGAGAAMLAPVAAGGAAGYGLAQLTDVDNRDIEDLKQQALIRKYREQAGLLKNDLRRFDARRG